MNRVFESDQAAKALFENLRSNLSDTRSLFSQLEEKCPPDEVDRLEDIEHKVESVNSSLKKLSQYIDITYYPPNRWQKIHLKEAILPALDKLKPYAEKKNITLNFEEKPMKGRGIAYGDVNVLSEFVFENIISNAIKYSFRDSVIDITFSEYDDMYYFHIVDRGVGIPKEILINQYSFQDRVLLPGTEGEFGSGLSIPLVKRVMKKLNGHVHYRSTLETTEPHPGTTVTLAFQKRA